MSTLRPVPDAETRVLIACSQSLLRAGYRAMLDAGAGIAVAGEAEDGEGAVDLARQLRPDAVVIDVDLPGCVNAAEQLCADSGAPVILLSGLADDERLFAALRAGATGVVSKDAAPDQLVRAIEIATRGDAILSPALTRRLIGELVSRPQPSRPCDKLVAGLTAREREVIALVARGLSNDEIAQQLVVSPATARTHVSRAMVKLRARDRSQLVVFAYESRLLTQPSRP